MEALPSDTGVVVSALGGLTDKLIATARLAADGGDWRSEADAIADRHFVIIEELVRAYEVCDYASRSITSSGYVEATLS